jgi:HlyD family secretion protein
MKGFHWALCALLVGACSVDTAPTPLVGTLERDRLELVAEANEEIIELRVAEGDLVSEGQLLMRLESAVKKAELQAAEAVRERAAQRVAELIRGPREERIRAAQARLGGAQDNLEIQRSELERIAALIERGLASAADLDRARNSVETARAQVDTYRAELDELLDGTTREELAQAEAQLSEADARVELARIVVRRMDIVAPRAGRIDALPYKLGERPPAGATVIVMLADQAPFARIYVPEPMRARVHPGLAARVNVDGVAGSFEGTVRYVSADATFTPYFALTQRDRSRLAFLAEVTLTQDAARELPSGVPVQVDFPGLQ